MLAVTCTSQSADDPLSGLTVGERPDPDVPDGWVRVHVKAAALNHHDLWSLKGVGLAADKLPMILGCDAAGVTDDGREVVVHAVVSTPGWAGDETLDPAARCCLSCTTGLLPRRSSFRPRNVLPKPTALSWEEAACLPTAWLTAYRMLFTQSGLRPGDTVLVQGAGGGVATAAISLARAAGFVVWATSRDEGKREQALRARCACGLRDGRALAGPRRRGSGDRGQGHLVALAASRFAPAALLWCLVRPLAPTRRRTSTGCFSFNCGSLAPRWVRGLSWQVS